MPENAYAPATLESARQGGAVLVTLAGDWQRERPYPDASSAIALLQKGGIGPIGGIRFEAASLGEFDSSLASVLLGLARKAEAVGVPVDWSGLPEGLRELLHMALAVPEMRDADQRGRQEVSFFSRVGEASIRLYDDILDLHNFIGECLYSFLRFLRGKARFRRQDLWVIIQECGAEALPIVSLISILVGTVLAFVGIAQLKNFGATIFVADLVAIAVVREMGCMMTGVIMAGRTGAAFAAQIGSMKINQEIDSLRTFGFRPIDYLVLPRMIALILMMPLLTIYANVVGILGGIVVGTFSGITFQQYITQTYEVLTLTNISIGVVKGGIFGVVIAAAGCLRGMQCGNTSSAVGTAATSAVVTSITMIIVIDAAAAIITTMLDI